MLGGNSLILLIEASDEGNDLRKLRIILGHAKNQLQEAQSRNNVHAGRYAIRQMLTGLIDLLEQDQEIKDEKLASPLVELFNALSELDTGSQPGILTPRQTESRPLNSDPKAYLHGAAAGIMDVLMTKADNKKEEAAQKVAKALDQAGYSLPGREPKRITATTVKNWRDRAANPRSDAPDMMRHSYQVFRACTDRLHIPLVKLQDRLLKIVGDLVGELGLVKGYHK